MEAFLASARRAAGENPDVAFGLDLDPSLLANARLFTTAGPAGKAGTFAIVGDELVAVSKRGAPDGFTFQAALLAVQEGARRATVPANGAEAVLAVAGFRPVARAPGAEGELDRLVMVYDPDALELPDLSKVPSVETLEDAVALQRKEVRRISRRTNDRRRRAAAAAATAAATGGAGGASAAVAPELQQDGESPADAPADAPVPATDMVAGITEDVARSVFQTLKRGQREAERIEDFVPDSTLDAIYDAVHVQGNRVAPLEGIDFNFDKFDSAESTLQVINALATEYEGATTAAKRGVQTFADTQELADRLSAATGDETLKLVLTRKEGQLLNDFQLKAAFDLYEKLAADTVDLTKKLAGPGATPEDAVRLNHRLSLMGAFHAQLKGAQTETARALSAMRMMRGNSQVAAAQIEDILANTGGLETAQAKARILLQEQTKAVQRGANPTGALSQAGRNLERATTLDMVFESWIGGLLSGPVTLFGVNNLGNATLVAANLMERGMAATGRSLLRTAGLSSEEGVAWAEFERYALGTLTGARVGWSLFWDALRTGEPALVTKLGMEGPDYRKAITGENVAQLPLVKGATNYVTKAARNVDARLPGGAMLEPALMRTGSALSGTVDVLGEYYFRMPYRILQAEDQFWQSISYAAELQAQAWRSATDQVQRGTAADVTKRYQEILSNPQDELPDVHIRALQHAREATLAQNPGEAAMFLSRAINTDPLRPLAKVVMPFFRVVNNSLRWTGDRLPMKYFMKHQRDRLLTPAGRDMELAKMTTGAMLIGSGVWFVNTVPFGVSATAGPDVGEPKQRRAALLLNRDGNSITVPWSRIDPDGTFKGWLHDGLDKSYDVRKLEPATTLFLVSAITSEIIKYAESPQEQEEAAMLAIQSFKDVLLDSSWATGIAQFANAVSGEFSPEQGADKMRRYISRVGGSLVPSLAATGRRAVDSTLRDDAPDNPFDTQSGKLLSAMYNSMCNRWPGCSEDLPALVNLFGDEIQLEGALGPDLVSPIYTSTPVIQQGDLERAGLPEYIVQAHTFRNLRLGQNLTREDLERFVDVTGAYGELERLSLPVDKRRREWKGVPLTPAQWNFVTRYEGPRIRAALEDLVRDPLYLDAPEEDDVDGSKQKLMTAIVGMVREETDIQLMSEPEWADVRDARLLREYVRDHGRFPGRTTPLGAGLLGEDVLPDPEASDMPVAPDAAVHELLRGRYQ